MSGKIDKLMGGVFREKDGESISTAQIETQIETLVEKSVETTVVEKMGEVENNASRLISGSVTWLQDLDFQVSPLVYEILGKRRESVEKVVTIPDNTESNPRFAVISADIFGNVGYILGAAAADPVVPVVNPSTQLLVTTIYIEALGTEPAPNPDPDPEPGEEIPEITTEVIYDENIEWQTAKTEETNLSIDFDAVTDPANGIKHIKVDLNDPAPGSWETGSLKTSAISGSLAVEITEETTTLNATLEELFPVHKTDLTTGNTRTATWVNIASKNMVRANLVSQTTGQQIRLKAMPFSSSETWGIPELILNFLLELWDVLELITVSGTIPVDNYTLEVEGFTKYEQSFTQLENQVYNPASAKMTFTRGTAINAKGGTIALSLKPGSEWLSTTGLLFELYNGSAKVGSLSILPGNSHGFNPDLTAYQRITIPVADFKPTSDLITALVIRPVNSWPNGSVLEIDNIVLQVGTQPQTWTDRFVESANLDTKALLKLKRSAGLSDLDVQFGTMALKTFWIGTQAEYDAIPVKDADTIYHIEE
ncbi:hypothetical protein N9164_16050 [Draconibacterium sp.]|nr:hypothetical protein [Draconibacterium sp.]